MSKLEREYEELILTLPRAKGWFNANMYEYQGSWYPDEFLGRAISCQKHFEARDDDVFLATYPKSGTTWLKAIMFSLLNRAQHPPLSPTHPLHTHNPHELVFFLEMSIDHGLISSPRMFSTHFPYTSLPESIRSNGSCKIVYVCRDPKDILVSLWIFSNKNMRPPQEVEKNSIEDVFELFCTGISPAGAFWEHILQYWKQMKENPHMVLFLTYESMKEQPEVHIRRLAEFLGCPFSAEEEKSGIPTQILNLCSFDSLSNLEVNKNEKILSRSGIPVEKNTFFRRGEIGDWKNHLSEEMADRLDQIIRQKLSESGLFI